MNGIEKITEKIISEARAEANGITESAREKALAVSRGYAQKAAEAKSSIEEAASAEANAIMERTKASLETVQRSALLAEQAAIIDEVFSDADTLSEIGLDVPSVAKIASSLRKSGFDLRGELYTVDGVKEAIIDYIGRCKA